MTDDNETTIDGFVGNDYVSDGQWDGQPPQHAAWFPVSGVRMTLYKVAMTTAGKAYAKVTISASPAKGAIEKAIYRAQDDGTLVAEDIELQPGLLCNEILILQVDGQGKRVAVEHHLEFSDGSKGKWLCPDRPKVFSAGAPASIHA